MIGWRIQRVAATGSTNDDVKNAAEAGESEGLVITAREQTSGRGRQGRVWHSPEGNLYASVLLRPRIPVSEWPTYSFVVALSIYDAVQKALPSAPITLKWPNDVLVDGKKISGILIETVEGGLVVGIGINILHFPAEALYPCTSLAAEGNQQVTISAVLDDLLIALDRWHMVRQTQGFEVVRNDWLAHAKQGILKVKLPGQETPIEGLMNGLDEQGNLILRMDNEQDRLISTGDVLGFL
ncbi:MAG: biotin--[acetyl-CoA-carboxylase] ligase [Alphaproteobacteria bacterium]|nr:biotin--[acetyl-CoA-carboxylase] ligase [Alphaproteobacteria bacterium]MBV8548316.1 biotin--[acetyl-CoA-carboxylase] ligase [Alphaproteobacteria bacterium]